MLKVFTLYNNKGGVSKTTTTFNLAVFLSSKKGKKVLIIDADSQSNITELFFSSDPKFLDSESDDLPGTSIFDALRPRLEGNTARVDVKKIKLCKNKRYNNLFLLRGDINFSAQAEGYFSTSVDQSITSNIYQKNTYLSFRRLVRDLANEYGFDHIIFDLGPSTGAISRLALLACDGYFIPVTPDRFSLLAVRSLPKILEEWFSHDKKIIETLHPYGIENDYVNPIFSGAISQQFQVHKGKIKKSFDRWNDSIKKELKIGFTTNSLIPYNIDRQIDTVISEIENLGPLAPLSQLLGKAIFDITQNDTKLASSDGQAYYGAVFAPWQTKISNYESQIEKIALAVL